ncbi:uncharacterized protein LOC129737935 [Uranotaenia lowii]|uniref:uncharacterized protein LOC129737935 n=1 Tax=Uranotaenia lowii TaxID=190385 RepID=UPI002478DCDE|nr:uncharacterized protein LOC129737935 [Uranotaenia lowii]
MVHVKERQTASVLSSKILDLLAEYNVPVDHIWSVTVDNGANMLAAVKKLQNEIQIAIIETLEDDDMDDLEPQFDITAALTAELQERINLVRCAVHTLQLAILDVVDKSHPKVSSLTDLAKKVKNIKYKTNFDHHGASHPPIWSQTRWGGIFEMVQSFHSQKSFFEQLAIQFPELDLSNHWSFIDSYYDAFKPLYLCTKKMQEHHVSLSDFYIAWLMAMSEVRKCTVNSFVPALLNSLKTRLSALRNSRAFKISLYLDPRINYHGSTFFSPQEKVEIQGYINETWQRIRQLQSTSLTPNMTNEAFIESENNDDFDAYLTEMFGGSVDTESSSETKFLQQLQSLDLEPRQNHSFDIWNHWVSRKTTHPELYAVAMVVLATPSNQVSVERSFSALGLILTNRRTNLGENTLSNILMVKLNKDLFQEAISSAYNWKDLNR